MNISIYWLPLILTIIICLLGFIFSGFRYSDNPLDADSALGAGLNILGGIVAFFSIIFYIIVAIIYIFNHIHFVT